MISISVLVLLVMLLIAPLRKLLFRFWYVILPGVGGIVFGLHYAADAIAQGAPSAIWIIAPLLAAASFVGALRGCHGSGRDHDDEGRR